MDKDRIAGSAKEIKGAVKQVVGKAVGDAKLQSEGKADKRIRSRTPSAASKMHSRGNRLDSTPSKSQWIGQ
jgi:hypothetical protein